MDTLAPYAQSVDQPVTPLDSLRERLLSPVPLEDWKDHIRRSFDAPDHAPEGGESHAALLARWALALSEIASVQGTPAFVTHGGMTAALFHALDPGFGFDDWASLRNPDLFEITLEDGGLTAFTRIDLEEV
jgi:2,3-bisphosphoglycerate-dependent phosphoglycerate mutase